jgi:hypothetical protein
MLEERRETEAIRGGKEWNSVVQLGNSYAFALVFEVIAVRGIPYHRALRARLSLEPSGARWLITATVPGVSVRHKDLRVRIGEVRSLERGRRISDAFFTLLRSPQLFDFLCERGFAIASEDAPTSRE